MKWAHAVKLWNAHGKIYNPRHVYAIPRKGTAEHADVKHIQQHDELPAHLKKKGPFPAEALAQLQALAKESEARREVARQAQEGGAKPKKKRKAKAPIEIEEAEPEIAVPVLPARLEKQEEKKSFAPVQSRKKKTKETDLKEAAKGTADIREFLKPKKPKRDMSKILAGILAEAKRRKERKDVEEDVKGIEDILLERPAGPRRRKAPTALSGGDIESLLQEERVDAFRDIGKYKGMHTQHGSVHQLIRNLHQQKQDKKDEEGRLQGIISSMKRFGEDIPYWKKATPDDKAYMFEALMNAPSKIKSLALKSANNASIQKAFELYERVRDSKDRETAKEAIKGFRYTDEKAVKESKG